MTGIMLSTVAERVSTEPEVSHTAVTHTYIHTHTYTHTYTDIHTKHTHSHSHTPAAFKPSHLEYLIFRYERVKSLEEASLTYTQTHKAYKELHSPSPNTSQQEDKTKKSAMIYKRGGEALRIIYIRHASSKPPLIPTVVKSQRRDRRGREDWHRRHIRIHQSSNISQT